MALIELNLDKPALKRSETIGDEGDAASDGESTTHDAPDDTEFEDIDLGESESVDQSPGRLRRAGRLIGIAAVGVAGVVTLKKLRNRGEVSGDGTDSEF